MKNIFIALSKSDLLQIETLINSYELYEIYYFDPTLMDQIEIMNLKNSYFIYPDGIDTLINIEFMSRKLSYDFEKDLTKSINNTGLLLDFVGWQMFTLRPMFANILWYSQLWNKIIDKIPEGKYIIIVNNNPQYFQQPSFIPSILLLDYLNIKGIPFEAFTYGEINNDTDAIVGIEINQKSPRPYKILSHLPTILYDGDFINNCISKIFPKSKVLSIGAKHWNFEVSSDNKIGVFRGGKRDKIAFDLNWTDAEYSNLVDAIDLLLRPYIKFDYYRSVQAKSLAKMYESEIISLILLRQYFKESLPELILISDHDAGLHGALITFANEYKIKKIVVPHSKFILDNGFLNSNCTYLNHPLQKYIPSITNGFSSRSNLKFPIKHVFKNPKNCNLNSIGLVLNSISENGVLGVNLNEYINGIILINNLCKENGISLKIRSRPGMSLSSLLSKSVNFGQMQIIYESNKSIDDYFQGIDLCIMYHVPSSALLSSLEAGKAVININPSGLDFWVSGYIDEMIVPAFNISDGIEFLKKIMFDEYFNFSSKQLIRYFDKINNSNSFRKLINNQ